MVPAVCYIARLFYGCRVEQLLYTQDNTLPPVFLEAQQKAMIQAKAERDAAKAKRKKQCEPGTKLTAHEKKRRRTLIKGWAEELLHPDKYHGSGHQAIFKVV